MFNEERHFEQPIRWAMVGGGRGSQIGYSHRNAAQRDGLFKLVAGAFDLDADRCRDFGVNLGLDPERCYSSYKELFAQEAQREDGIQAVSIATPNSTHYEICKAALEAKLHVVCEKPITFTTEEAQELKTIAAQNNRVIGVMYGYTGFPMVQQAREMVQRGDLGEVRVINMQFAHGFHNEEYEKNDPGLKWRVSPEVSGPTYVLGDIGTHAFYLNEVMTGLEVDSLACMRQSFIESRAPLEDNAHVMIKFKGGAVGTLWASAVNSGSMHQQKIRIVGSKASIEWWDEYPNQLRYEVQGEAPRVLERGMGYLYQDAEGVASNRVGGGHAEGYFESWANLYHRFAMAFDAADRDDQEALAGIWFPGIDAGIEGVRLCEKCVESADQGAAWVSYK
ncbi:Gfo/Idh/MocA family protein [Vibrio mediterranei]|uniref:Gfo/Idh/MocA family oxidoreductase n=1 Tax=Vibrio mediterranei TaxID=689 RepID=A0ABX5D9C6_9VIBR|nr:Gfo/Idh/MocA family oxidoreductase [Vibrio mediterranei]MCG9659961.1 Gfo/Idh/MocA family oxidoreductase [Vibrio mediterranei]MCG9664849.1 Gfo/Idh/MocA family oxidoreductase [Vibrio mediterranei]PCD89706.1 gfo/Idh/MocA family oxidoreductase [Vibrio mediterranei]PRQ65075.1 gfo/Idh/MocA family oxidoreductase [Vibrio mediterranei]SBO11459.1 Glucose--fructose oxidoreductase precursor [Vibrio mediterranei]